MNTTIDNNKNNEGAPHGGFEDMRPTEDSQQDIMGQGLQNVTDAALVVSEQKQVLSPLTMLNPARNIRQELIDFFRKPIAYVSGSLATTDNATTFVGTGGFCPGGVISVSSNYKDRIKGFLGMRATTVLTLQVNANRFQQGRYMVCALPIAGTASDGVATGPLLANRFSLVQCVQLPHVELDVACDTQAILRLPFINTHQMQPIGQWSTSTNADCYQFFIRPYVALTAPTGSTTAPYTLWVHFEDIEFEGPTVFQSGMRKVKKNLQLAEAESPSNGPISSVAVKVQETMSIVNKIPTLSAFATPAMWVAGYVADIAKVWGYSKPRDVGSTTFMQRTVAHAIGNVDNKSKAFPLSFSNEHEIEALPGFAGTDVDEMAFANIVNRPGWVTTYNWTTAQTTGTVMFQRGVCPYQFITNLTDSSVSTVNYAPVAFVAQFFQLWRGSLTFRLKFVKTEFHSGRLLVWFEPGSYTDGKTPSGGGITTSITSLRTIIDVREGHEFDITVPFISLQNYLDQNQPVGFLNFVILDPLCAPASVSSTVSMIVEVFGGDDMEFAQPCNSGSFPFIPYIPNTAQSFNPNVCRLTTQNIGGSEINSTLLHSRACVGEKIVSFRQLVKVVTPFIPNSVINIQGTILTLAPWAWQPAGNSGAALNQSAYTPDTITLLSPIFALYRGGINYTIKPSRNELYVSKLLTTDPNNNAPLFVATTANSIQPPWQNALTPNVLVDTTTMGVININVPYYSKYASSSTLDSVYIASGSYTGVTTTPRYLVNVQPYNINNGDNATNKQYYYVWRGAADDFSFGGFKSIPPFVKASQP